MEQSGERTAWAGWSAHVDVTSRRARSAGHDADALLVAPPRAPRVTAGRWARPSHDSDLRGSSVALRRVFPMSTTAREWIAGHHGHGGLVHDVHVTLRDGSGAVVARYCLRHAGLSGAVADGREGAAAGPTGVIDELVLTCESIDVEPVDGG